MTYTLNLGYFYPELLNLYGDQGNIFCLKKRCEWRDISVTVNDYPLGAALPDRSAKSYPDLIFMGGGPDKSQLAVAANLSRIGHWLSDFVDLGGVGLFICGAYQLLGQYYQDADGGRLDGLGLFDLYTRHFGKDKKRCIGNVVVETDFLRDPTLNIRGKNTLVGFENHGGRTYLGPTAKPLGLVRHGFGNNGTDKTEGVIYKNAFGTYLHGPLLPKNPHFADHLISLALKRKYGEDIPLKPLDDKLEWQAHAAAEKLR